MEGLLLGIDLGTSGVKTGVYDPAGRLLAIGRASFPPFHSPRPGWAESDPLSWWKAVVSSIREACSEGSISGESIGGVGLSVFFPAIIPLDSRGNVLHPALLYNDQRSHRQVEDILERIPREEYEEITGNVLVPGTSAVTSIAWLRDEQPRVYDSAEVFAFANTFITSRFTGEYTTDPTMASLSGLSDVSDFRKWSAYLCDAIPMDIQRLPGIAGSAEVIGEIRQSAAEETGLKEGTPVVCGCGDAVASSFGAGAYKEGDLVYIAGSSDCVTSPLERPTRDRRLANLAFVAKDCWFAMGAATSTGSSVDWFIRNFTDSESGDAYGEMIELARSCRPGSNGLLFLPYLQGERTPVWDPLARGMFVGLSIATTKNELARAVYEGTAFALKDVIQCLEGILTSEKTEIRAVGGGTKNPFWNQIKADVLQKPLDVIQFKETGSLGAALLAGIGTGVYESALEAVGIARGVSHARRVEPDRSRRDHYDELYSVYIEVYPQMKGILHRLSTGS
jgi:xylulokinase